MIIVMNPNSTSGHVDYVLKLLDGRGSRGWLIEGNSQKVVEVLGDHRRGVEELAAIEKAPMVDRILTHGGPLLAAGRRTHDRTLEVPLGGKAVVGGPKLAVIAGPCSVESRAQLLEIAVAVKEAGAVGLRGGAFKPRTSPYSFQGHGEKALEWLALAGEETGLAVVTEVLHCECVGLVAKYADVLQVGSRNMHHTPLLTAVGRQDKPVLLKRGWSASLEEFLLAAEYVMLEGNRNVILCERGIRTHETYVRNTLALAVVPEIKHVSQLPIIVDPSHGTGKRRLVAPMSHAAIACGADGLLIETHVNPDQAWTDGDQTLGIEQFRSLMDTSARLAEAVGRTA